ncbi:MAG: hypothetical protein CSA66_07550 [Proteobacteria bacterium]|nr:MAG: hypothetical protein CSA66_07550 [Pseudomonadota bacterium]
MPSSSPTRALALIVAAALTAGAPLDGPARASMFDTHGFSARAIALGNARVALGADYDAVYYNPANVLSRKRTHIGAGLDLVAPELAFDVVSGDPEVLMPRMTAGFHFGASTPVSGVFDNRVGLGVALFHPLTSGTRVESIDPSVPYFYRYQNLPDKLVVAAAAAFEPAAWVRIGAGVQILAELAGEVKASLSLAEGRFTHEDMYIELVPTASPTFGLALGPFEGLRFGATWRQALQLDYEIPVTATIEEVGDLDVYVKGVSLYTPSQLALGLSWESAPAPAPGWSVEGGLTWEEWSAAPPAGAIFELSIDDAELRPVTDPQDRPDLLVDVASGRVPLAARDTVTPRLGLEWRPDATWAVRAGWFWRPTPLPTPVHATNSLDASAHVFSLGGGVTFGDPLGVSPTPVSLDLTAQLTRLSNRAVVKSAVGTPQGAYTFGGLLWHVSLDLRHDYM